MHLDLLSISCRDSTLMSVRLLLGLRGNPFQFWSCLKTEETFLGTKKAGEITDTVPTVKYCQIDNNQNGFLCSVGIHRHSCASFSRSLVCGCILQQEDKLWQKKAAGSKKAADKTVQLGNPTLENRQRDNSAWSVISHVFIPRFSFREATNKNRMEWFYFYNLW